MPQWKNKSGVCGGNIYLFIYIVFVSMKVVMNDERDRERDKKTDVYIERDSEKL